MRFTPDFLDRLRNHLSISQVIGKRIQIKKHGREFHALCPFHSEKSPSFTISDEKNFYHCFGCGAHGDSIGFIKDYERLTYVEAVEKLANEAGLALPAVDPREQAAYARYATSQSICEEAALWFQKQLLSNEGHIARDYLKGRGVSQEMIAQFRIGYSLNARDGLKQHLLKKGVSEEDQIAMGILIKPDSGATYDRFRGRLMFPICDIRGRVVAFGGRTLNASDANAGPKYLNSPETILFKKGEMLYGLHHARRGISEQNTALITEGYLDVIALHQAGLPVAVAPLGTAITEHHLTLLWRLVPDPVLCLDGDAAGSRAMLRAAELALPLLKAGFGLKFAALPAGEDPDSLIQKRGASAMKAIVSSALTLSETLWNVTARSVGTNSPEARAALDAKLHAMTEVIPDRSLKQHMREYFTKQMRALDAPKTSSKNTPWNQAGGKGGFDKKRGLASAPKVPQSPLVAALAAQDPSAASKNRIENQLVALIVRVPELLQQVEIEEEFARLPLVQPSLDKLRAALIELCANAEKPTHEQLARELQSRGLSETLSPLMQHAVLPKFLNSPVTDDPVHLERARTLWQQMMTVYYRSEMEMERRKVLSDVGSWGDEARMKEIGAANNSLPKSSHFIISEE